MVWENFVKLNPSTRYENEMSESRLRLFNNRVLRECLNRRVGRRQENGYSFTARSF